MPLGRCMCRLSAAKGTTINQLRKLLFGARTEKTANVCGDDSSSPSAAAAASEGETPRGENNGPSAMTGESEGESQKGQQRTKGHGRNGAEAYEGAKRVRVPHATLKAGDSCPECRRGTVYAVATPGTLMRLVGQPPLHATVYELEKLRCHLCGKVFTAAAPPEVGPDKYDASSAALIGLLTYGAGMPLNRSERLHDYFEIPLPASTQWDVLANASERYRPPYRARAPKLRGRECELRRGMPVCVGVAESCLASADSGRNHGTS
jgi:transposase